MEYRIGIDIGTTSTKGVLYNKQLAVVEAAVESYPTLRAVEGMAEQDPEHIVGAVISVIQQLLQNNEDIRKQVKSVSFSSAMHSTLLLSSEGKPLGPVYTWADNRSNDVLETIRHEGDLHWVYERTGTPIHSMSPFSKLLWLKKISPELLLEAEHIVGIKEYVMFLFTGEWKIDYSIASATGLFNLQTLDWDRDILEFIGLDRESFSAPVDTNYVYTQSLEGMYDKAGLSLDTVLVIGASDGCLANLGLNAVGLNEVAMTIGTSGALRMVTDQIILDPKGRLFCYYLSKNRWVVGGAVNNGGNAFQWLADVLSLNYEQLNKLAEEVDPGSDGLMFYPYLNGERAPLWDGSVKAQFIGIDAIHSKGHFVRALMEGVLYNLAEVLEILEKSSEKSRCIKVTGGYLRSSLWKQMTADIFNKQIILSKQFESSCLGAVLIGELDNESQLRSDSAEESIIEPDADRVQMYGELFELYQKLSVPLKEMQRIRQGYLINNQ
ncbi:gluconokinase [Alkalibacterium subtropicum]|uniref:Gluconokinase n=1 Tax=Alkalibacterium subtropicum TaxID=753702 RepID=A0A1I1HSW7_9LACT|nr:gluconokinase [Alkalibacterium subtropicum]SFC26986.1 gluconokinase [Alkalibacterium subtropicum]